LNKNECWIQKFYVLDKWKLIKSKVEPGIILAKSVIALQSLYVNKSGAIVRDAIVGEEDWRERFCPWTST
jgi:hypothetical protein